MACTACQKAATAWEVLNSLKGVQALQGLAT